MEGWTLLYVTGIAKQLNARLSWVISKILSLFRGSISHVKANDSVGISASYDATLMIWDLARKDLTKKLIGPHK